MEVGKERLNPVFRLVNFVAFNRIKVTQQERQHKEDEYGMNFKTNLPPRPRYFILMSQLPYTALAHGHKGISGLRGKLQKATPR